MSQKKKDAAEDIKVEENIEAQTEENAEETVVETEEKKAQEENTTETPDDGKDKKDLKIEELNDRLMRNMAEFENFRKRSEKEKSQMFEIGAKSIVEKILPIIDNFERGLGTITEAEKESAWDLCKPDKAGRWSAVAYYFADKIARETGVTVGIIGCNWGGTSVSCWMPEEDLIPDFQTYMDLKNQTLAYDLEQGFEAMKNGGSGNCRQKRKRIRIFLCRLRFWQLRNQGFRMRI